MEGTCSWLSEVHTWLQSHSELKQSPLPLSPLHLHLPTSPSRLLFSNHTGLFNAAQTHQAQDLCTCHSPSWNTFRPDYHLAPDLLVFVQIATPLSGLPWSPNTPLCSAFPLTTVLSILQPARNLLLTFIIYCPMPSIRMSAPQRWGFLSVLFPSVLPVPTTESGTQ